MHFNLLLGVAIVSACSKTPNDQVVIKDGVRLTYGTKADPSVDAKRDTESTPRADLDKAVAIMRRRLEALNVLGRVFIQDGRIVADLKGAPEEASRRARLLISKQGMLELTVVDSNAEFVSRLAAHVAADRKAELEKIKVDAERWPTTGGEGGSDVFLAAPDRDLLMSREEARDSGCRDVDATPGDSVPCSVKGRAAIDRYLDRLAAQDARFVVPSDRRIIYEFVSPGRSSSDAFWRTYYVERTARISNASIQNAVTHVDPDTGEPQVLIDLDTTGAKAFEALTANIIGKKIAILIDGTVYGAPILQTKIVGGRFLIPVYGRPSMREQEAADLAIVLRHGPLPFQLYEVSATVIVDGVPQAIP